MTHWGISVVAEAVYVPYPGTLNFSRIARASIHLAISSVLFPFALWRDDHQKSFFLYCAGIDECASNPCQHDGVCTDMTYDYRCSCAEGYTGVDCQTGKICVWMIGLLEY